MDHATEVHQRLTSVSLGLSGEQVAAYERLKEGATSKRVLGSAIWTGTLEHRSADISARYACERLKDNASQEAIEAELLVLGRIIQTGLDAGLWTGCPPPIPLSRFRHGHTIEEHAVRRLDAYQRIVHAIKQPSALSLKDMSSRQLAGAVLTWLVMESGFASVAAIRRACFALSEPVLATGAFHYVELAFQAPSSGRSTMQRWFLGPMSTIMAIRFRGDVVGSLIKAKTKTITSSQTVWSAIRAYLSDPSVGLKDDLPDSLSEFCAISAANHLLHLPQLLCGFAKGEIASSSLPEQRFRAVIGYAPRERDRLKWPDTLGVELAQGVTEEKVRLSQQALLTAIEPGAPIHEVIEKLSALANRDPSEVLSSAALLAQWAVAGLGAAGKKTPARRIADCHRDLSRITPAVMAVCPTVSIDAITTQDATDTYALLMRMVRDNSLRGRLSRVFKKWLNFALAEAGEEAMSAGASHPVSANLLTYSEVRDAVKMLGTLEAETMDPELRKAAANYLLGTMLGLRSAEWMGLRTIDAQAVRIPTLSVLPYAKRRLKSAASSRIVPVGLLPPELESKLTAYIERAWDSHMSPRYPFLVSRADGERIQEHQLDVLIASVIKKTCADKNITKHHGRHSFGNHMTLAVFTDLVDLKSIRDQLGELGEAIDDAERLRRLLVGPQGGHRDGMTALSATMGHSWLMTTCEHYIHVLDICLHAGLKQCTHVHELALLRRASGLSESSIRPQRTPDISALLGIVERAYCENVIRDDVARPELERPHGLDLAEQYFNVWKSLSGGDDASSGSRQCTPELRDFEDRIGWLAEIRSSKPGSTHRRHNLECARPGGIPLPTLPPNSEAARGAIRATSVLQSLRDQNHPDLPDALMSFAYGLQSKEARVTVHSFDELKRFASMLQAGGIPKGDLYYGLGNVMAYGEPRPLNADAQNGRYWISIGTAPGDDRSERRDFSGAVWAWTMECICNGDWHVPF